MKGKNLLYLFLTLVCVILSINFVFMEKAKLQSSAVSRATDQMQGYGLTIDRQNFDASHAFIIDETGKQVFNYNVRFMNRSGENNKFILLVYFDYKQVSFTVGTDGSSQANYEFETKSNQDTTIPVHFSYKGTKQGVHSLVLSVVAGPNKHASQATMSTEWYGVNVRYELKNSADAQLPQVSAPNVPIDLLPANQFNGIRINLDANPTEKALLPPLTVKAKPNEKLDFTVLAGGYQDTEDYLAWITIGYLQIPWGDQNQSYWYFHIPTSQYAYKKLQIVAPNEKGDYEVCGYLALNPFVRIDDGFHQNLDIRTSYRFTLHVE